MEQSSVVLETESITEKSLSLDGFSQNAKLCMVHSQRKGYTVILQ